MNNDLISRSKLIETISQAQKKFPLDDRNPRAIGNRQCLFWIKNEVKNQPTAYDVDKVVGELILESIHQSNNASIIGTKDAIDIVKRGGVEDE